MPPGTSAQIYGAITGSTSTVLSSGPTLLKAGVNEARIVAMTYGPVAIDTVKKVVTDDVPNRADAITKWSAQNPMLATCAVAGAAGVVIMAAPAVVSTPLLSTVGFGAEGVKAYTLASVIHSGIGNVATGSLFATAQSAAAGGAGAVVLNGIVQVGGAAIAAGSGGLTWVKAKL